MGVSRFQRKFVALFVGVLVLVQAATFLIVVLVNKGNVREEVTANLRVGSRVFDRLLEARGRQVAQGVRVLSADFAFREAIASGDLPTIESVLANHGSRIDADSVLLVSLDGQMIADNREGIEAPVTFESNKLIGRAVEKGEATSIEIIGDSPYQVVMVPVRAPLPIAWVVIGHRIDDAFLAELERLTQLEVSFWSEPTLTRPAILESTLEMKDRGALLALLSSTPSGDSVQTVDLAGTEYLTLVRPIEISAGRRVSVVIQRNLAEAMQPFARLQLILLFVAGLALLATIIVGLIAARGVTRPVLELASAAAKLEEGDYSGELVARSNDEIGDLARLFNKMKDGIRSREEKILYQATHDSLTGLPNRALFLDRLDQSIRLAKRQNSSVSLLMMDLDRFKEINDTLGHFYGDRVLIETGTRLRQITRDSDTVARLGGDEFALMLVSTDEKNVPVVIQKVLDVFSEPFDLGEVRVEVDTSIGVVSYPTHGTDPKTLLQRADIAMYEAKRNQLDYAIYEQGKDEHSLERLSLMSELRQAVQRGEFELHYQPKVDLASGRTLHVEALVRWNHPRQGQISPVSFISLAEQSGNIGLITRWVLNRAISQVGEWKNDALSLVVAVNLSALDLLDSDLPSFIDAKLRENGVSSSHLLLEITESAVMRDPNYAMRILRELKALGIRLAIDDFGTGYSSLAHLKRLPVDELKIDKSFVMHMDSNSEDAVIVRSTIELGHNMGLKVIAEGVENVEAWEILKTFGCDMAQGYFMSPPLTADAFRKWLTQSIYGSPLPTDAPASLEVAN